MIAREEQYLLFHRFVLDHAKFTKAGKLDSKPYVYSLGLSVRAGAIKAAILVYASIAEAALRAHAEKRGYKLPSNPTWLYATTGHSVNSTEVSQINAYREWARKVLLEISYMIDEVTIKMGNGDLQQAEIAAEKSIITLNSFSEEQKKIIVPSRLKKVDELLSKSFETEKEGFALLVRSLELGVTGNLEYYQETSYYVTEGNRKIKEAAKLQISIYKEIQQVIAELENQSKTNN